MGQWWVIFPLYADAMIIESCRGVVDIGQCQLGHMVGLGQLQEFEFGKGSETKAVICVTIEIDRR